MLTARLFDNPIDQCDAGTEIGNCAGKPRVGSRIVGRFERDIEEDLADAEPIELVERCGHFISPLRRGGIVERFVGADKHDVTGWMPVGDARLDQPEELIDRFEQKNGVCGKRNQPRPKQVS
ncbi:hypothetical protein [Erythrobacter aureus]|uniref:hypothetical protein n=1 Tax=Erythrobacter aureus TaxID=2182384 RepID=UPI003A8F15B6